MFTLTCLWNGINTLTGADGRDLGWFSLLVAITVLAVGLRALGLADGVWGVWSALNWLAWSVPWALFFVMLTLRRPHRASGRRRPAGGRRADRLAAGLPAADRRGLTPR